jgi:amino acid adenylation domain-containing protein
VTSARREDRTTGSNCIPTLFAHWTTNKPDATALVWQGGRLSYRELDAQAQRLASHLHQLGVGPDKPVAVLLDRSPDLIVSLLAIVQAGGAYLPLDIAYPAARIASTLADADPVAVVTRSDLASLLPTDGPPVVRVDRLTTARSGQPIAPPAITEDHLAYVLYTSGSTGVPKGVCVTHRNVERLIHDRTFVDLGTDTVFLHDIAITFDPSACEIWGALLNGGCLALHPERVPTARGLGESIRQFGVTTMILATAVFNSVVDEDVTQLRGLRDLIIGGEAMSVPHVRKAVAQLSGTRIVNGYGPTESTVAVSYFEVTKELPADAKSVPIGRALQDARLYVLDAHQQQVPDGETGELCVGGPGVARGYLRRPELTAERFLADPFAPGGRLYRTGDSVRRRSDGLLEFVGRDDGQVKVRGIRIELGEIEHALARCPWVQRAVVTARANAAGERRLVAYVVPAQGRRVPNTSEAREELGRSLPEHMVPSAFVSLIEFPLTVNGKVDRAALPAASAARPELAVEYLAPRTPVEEQLVSTWAELLEMDRVGTLDNVFDLGASSLLAVRAVNRLRELHALELPLLKVFEQPTVAGMASFLQAAQAGQQGDAPIAAAAARAVLAARGDGSRSTPIAIVGMGGRFPGASTVPEFWRHLCEGVESVSFFTDSEIDPAVPEATVRDPLYVKARGILAGTEDFDAGFFGISPREAVLTDPQLRLLLEVTWETLESSGYVPEQFAGSVGLFVGKNNNTYQSETLARRRDLTDALGDFQVMVANEDQFLATRIAHRLDLTGPAVNVITACSTSLVAVVMAMQSLQSGCCDLALAGGASVAVPVRSGHAYQEGAMLSADGHTRTFDASSTGTVFSDGVALVALRRLGDALADGDTIYGVLRGGAINNDGAAKASYTAPSIEGQARVIAMAHALAGVRPRDITYVEAHGTATPVGDPIEIEALTRAFSLGTSDRGFCGIGSVKTNVGHLVIAAGATALIKVALALKHQVIPPSLHFHTPNPKIPFAETPFRVVDRLTPWTTDRLPRLAGVSSFGVGGTNAHVVVEEPPAEPTPDPSPRSAELLLLSARSAPALEAASCRLADFLGANPDVHLPDVAFTLHAGRRAFAHRRAVVSSSTAEAAQALRGAANPESATAPAMGAASTERAAPRPPEVVFLFPGQGSQYPGMAARLAREQPVFRAELDACLQMLDADIRSPLAALILEPAHGDLTATSARLRQTVFAQPALFMVEYALARQWQEWGVSPRMMIGHSVGEIVAATCAGVMSVQDGLRLVVGRARLMNELPAGGMLAVRRSAAELQSQLMPGLAVAVENSPGSCVVAGAHALLAEFQKVMDSMGIACRPLVTSHAFHTPMMDAALAPFTEMVRAVNLSPPRVPIASTITGTWLSPEQAVSPEHWASQLCLPVRFAAAAAEVLATPNRVLLEVGPRAVLTSLVRQQMVHRDSQHGLASAGDGSAREDLALQRTAGELWVRGISLLPLAIHGPGQRRRVALPTYPFEHQRYWVDGPGPQPDSPTPGLTVQADEKSFPAPADPVEPPTALAAGAVARGATTGKGHLPNLFSQQLQLMSRQLAVLRDSPASRRPPVNPLDTDER